MPFLPPPPIQPYTTWTGAQFSTYRLGGPIRQAYLPTNLDDAVRLLDWFCEVEPPLPRLNLLGWGSNSVIASAGITLPCVIFRKLTCIEPTQSLPDGRRAFKFGAGVHLAKVSKTALDHGLKGAEFMVGIPGTVGGAVRMNAGASAQETAPLVQKAWVYSLPARALQVWPHDKLAFEYRHSAIDPQKYVVLAAELAFEPGESADIAERMAFNRTFRQTHHPIEPNGGSVFRNFIEKPLPQPLNAEPSKTSPLDVAGAETPKIHYAGKMLEALGAKAWTEGGVRVSLKHANFIVNVANGTSTDVLKLMTRMQQAVQKAYGIKLHPENLFMGDASAEESALWQALLD
ncbi:MAG: UDP-N-acetylmuramate dehydrogenase [Vampirovibrionales bacterium]|nr:UDP-N-acetylmuramate dehydrogenase [Vampirovibrionales bacterium]